MKDSQWTIVRLIKPDGTIDVLCIISYAVDYCNQHPGWTWKYIKTED